MRNKKTKSKRQNFFAIYLLAFTLFICFLAPPLFAWDGTEPLIIDHRAVQRFSQIPEYWLERAKQLSVHYGHTSHGSQIVAGLNYLEAYIDPIRYKYKATITFSNPPRLPAQENPSALLMAELGAHPEDYWQGAAAQNETIQVLNGGSFDFSGWSWCGEHGNTAVVQDYIQSMVRIESQCPGVMFFYMTGASSPYRVANNNLIKQHCINNNKILFDFSDIEQYSPDGVYQPGYDGRGGWCETWVRQNPGVYQNIPPTTEVGGGGDGWLECSHAHGLFAIMKAQAFWYMMARLAGWDDGEGTSPPPEPPIIRYGDVSGDGEITAYDAALTAQAAVGLITLSVEQTLKADVNGDSEVTAYDAALIAQRAVGLIDKFPVE